MRPHLTAEQPQRAFRLRARDLSLRAIGPQVDCYSPTRRDVTDSVVIALWNATGTDMPAPSLGRHAG